MLSNKIKYGIQAVVYMAANYQNEVVSAKQLSYSLDIPKEFISKILQELVHERILFSKKGKNGGFGFRIQPKDIKLKMIFETLGYSPELQNCLLGLNGFCSEKVCDLCFNWNSFNENMDNVLKNFSIKKLSNEKFSIIK